MKTEPLICWALTPQGAELARGLASRLGAEVRLPQRLARPGEGGFVRLADALAGEWPGAGGHVFVAAAGLVVRCLAPLLRRKDADPAVVVCDQNGRFAVSLLSGHLGGANALARDVARLLGGQAVITTATDCAGLPAFDVLAAAAGCSFADPGEVRAVSAALLAGADIVVADPLRVLDAASLESCPQCRAAGRYAPGQSEASGIRPDIRVEVSLTPLDPRPGLLRLHPRRVHAGVGCRRNVPGPVIARAVRNALEEARITPLALAALASADLKADDPGLTLAALEFGVPLRCFSAADLAAVPAPHPSARAAEVLAVDRVGVCEAAALLSAGFCGRQDGQQGGGLLLPKRVYGAAGELSGELSSGAGMVTVALALSRLSADP